MDNRRHIIAVTVAAAALLIPSTAQAVQNSAPQYIIIAAHARSAPRGNTTKRRAWIICRYWHGRQCTNAVNVAWCESGLRPWARNGQYRGMFQMGSNERATYGNGANAWSQARAARRYYALAGWRPWSCKP